MKTISVIHIEKCGGTSLRDAIKNQLPEGEFRQCYDEAGIESVAKEIKQGREIKVVYGHFSFGVHRSLGVEPNYATQMREPISRFVSHFTHWKDRLKFNHNRQHILQHCPTIDKFVEDEISNKISNFMVRRLANVHYLDEANEKHLKIAIENVKKYFSSVTFIEEPYRCNDSWNYLLGIDSFRIGHLNRGNSKVNFPEGETLEKINRANKLDIILYKECLNLFL